MSFSTVNLQKYFLVAFLSIVIAACNNTGNTNSSEQESSSVDNRPVEIQQKIDKINQYAADINAISDASNIYSTEQLQRIQRKLQIIESLVALADEIERAGYSDEISNYHDFMGSIRLKYSGLKLQKEALVEMSNNGTIDGGQGNMNYENNSVNSNSELSNNIDEYFQSEEALLEIMIMAYNKARSDYLYAGEGNFHQLGNEIVNDYYPRKKREYEAFYLKYSSMLNSDQTRRYSELKRRAENLFIRAFERN